MVERLCARSDLALDDAEWRGTMRSKPRRLGSPRGATGQMHAGVRGQLLLRAAGQKTLAVAQIRATDRAWCSRHIHLAERTLMKT
jgi:hypothetical protein